MLENRSKDVEVLKNIHKNASMSLDAMQLLETKITETSLKEDIKQQMTAFSDIEKQARQELEMLGAVPPLSGMSAGLWMSTRLNTPKSKTQSHIAQMLIEGSNTGVIEVTRALNTHSEADGKLKEIAERMLTAEQNSIDVMKRYL